MRKMMALALVCLPLAGCDGLSMDQVDGIQKKLPPGCTVRNVGNIWTPIYLIRCKAQGTQTVRYGTSKHDYQTIMTIEGDEDDPGT